MLPTIRKIDIKSQSLNSAENLGLHLISGSSNIPLSGGISQYLGAQLGSRELKSFSDGEIYVQIHESIRGDDIYIIQSTCYPVSCHLTELLIMLDACRRASAKQVTAVIPYYGYARADRKVAGRESITAKLVANLITAAGADRVIALDLHSPQVEGYFDIPIEHIQAAPVLLDYLHQEQLSDVVIVSPDIGGVARARAFAKQFNDAPLAIVDKRRKAHNVAEAFNVIGDVKGKTAILVDDIIDTGGTLVESAKILKREGAKSIYACATHAVFSGNAVEKLSSGLFEKVIITNTIPTPKEKFFKQLIILSVGNLLGEVIHRVHQNSSLIDSSL